MDEVEFAVHTDAGCNVAQEESVCGDVAQEEPARGESCEEEFNALGVLDLVYVEEDKKETSEYFERKEIPSSSIPKEIDQSDGDEEGELEPVAAVDVSPIREEDFLPEAMNEDVLESNKSTWTTSSASNADSELHQWRVQENPLLNIENANQLTEQQSQLIWNMQSNRIINQHLPNAVPKDFSYRRNFQLNQCSNTSLPRRTQKLPLEVKSAISRREYRQQYRLRNPELDRIRNREYARRYRLVHGDRVRQRQRDYTKKYRERKRLLEEAAFKKRIREQDDVIVLSSKCVERGSVMTNSDIQKDKSSLGMSERSMISALSSKNESEELVTVDEQDEVVVV